jgi:3-deoxy-D-manno-octulosonic-acid transferase
MYLFVLGIRISAIWNQKSQHWLSGRKNWDSDLKKIPLKNDFRIWFHVSSLGEFEQARPVIEKIKELRPGTEIILSFFSPSGFLQKHDYPFATVTYLPADLPGNAKKWIQMIDPDYAVFTKYDLWPGYLKALSDKKIPAILISANWIPGGFNSWSNPLIKGFLKEFKMIFLQRKEHLTTIQNIGFPNTQVSGDTRIDRSLELPAEVEARIPEKLKAYGHFDLIAGSTWPDDEKILSDAIHHMSLKTIIAPHNVSADNIDRLIKSLKVPLYQTLRIKEVR